ncbi:FlgB [Desulforapulum autotrophicum HRM2]|uniref:Flagellar basal body rod protein FlgB n=1 Tax=Desulforapulum autotrophicum (strain ATCC 43914 / DSM 3382 / VKM B-1955 / HRM2) TaxID=177437 RepID=C0QAK7_DESAH|nr:flagellar basal body rod protein FlgB [Desulforapulum autotrophicum]ACN16790.1 FlgB [Desulforapulum autotrophicum HRM2]
MSDSRIFNRTYEVLSTSLDVSARRHNLITGNIANMDTIGYEPKDLDFQKTLKRAMAEEPPDKISRTDARHFSGAGQTSMSMDGSVSQDVDIHHLDSVNIDTEMANLVENNIKYRTTTELLLRKMATLRHAIQEGGN